MNSVEKHLASWTPLRPSPALRDRIFGTGRTVLDADPVATLGSVFEGWRRAVWLGWLAPATGATLLMVVTLLQPAARWNGAVVEASEREAFTHTSTFAALQTAPVHSAANNLVAASFTWTNTVLPPSTNASFRGEASPF